VNAVAPLRPQFDKGKQCCTGHRRTALPAQRRSVPRPRTIQYRIRDEWCVSVIEALLDAGAAPAPRRSTAG